MRVFMQAGTFVLGSSMVYLIVAACSGGGSGGIGGDGGVIPNADAQNNGLTKTVSADSDPAQAVGGGRVVQSGESVELGSGPFYLTDLVTEYLVEIGTVQAGQPCDGFEPFKEIYVDATNPGGSIHGARFLIASNETLCASGSGTFRWAGFRPY